MSTILSTLIGVHAAMVELVAGMLLFAALVITPGRTARPEESAVLRRGLALGFLLVGTLAMIGWLWLVAAVMAGLRTLPSPPIVFATLSTTRFGWIWAGRALVASFAISALIRDRARPTRRDAALVWSLILLASLALTTRAAEPSAPRYALAAAETVHLLATAAWAGALVPLAALALRLRGADPSPWREAARAMARRCRRYFAAAGVGLAATGAALAWTLAGGPGAPHLDSPYGRILAAEAGLGLAMLALGTAGRLVLWPRLLAGRPRAFGMVATATAIEGLLALAAIAAGAVMASTPLAVG